MRARVLVVDDNPRYRRLVRRSLEGDLGFEVVAEAATAEEALELVAHARPDVALIDVLLPAGQGFRLPTLLREIAPGCVVVLTSAHPEDDLESRSHLGGIAFLAKSVAPSLLGRELAALVAVLDQVEDVLDQAATNLPASRDSPRAARRFVEGILEAWGFVELLDTVTLLVSELVGNAVLHTTSEVELSVRLVADRLRVDVIDRSTSLPQRRAPSEEDLTGRGSELVEMLATAWGVSGRPDGKSVWFEIALPAAVTS